MISDVLSNAVIRIDEYLDENNEIFAKMYSGSLRQRIINLRNDMDALRKYLDNPFVGVNNDR